MLKVIETKDLDKHLPAIVFSKNLNDLTAEQIQSIAFLMEKAYQKGKDEVGSATYEVNEIKGMKYATHVSPTITINTNGQDTKGAVNKVLEEVFEKMLRNTGTRKHNGPCVSETGGGPCEKCGE